MKPVRERNAIRLIESMSAPYAAIASMKGAKLATAPVIAPAWIRAGKRTRMLQGTIALNVLLILVIVILHRTGVELFGCSRFRCHHSNAVRATLVG